MFVDVSLLPLHEILPGFSGRFIHSEKITIAYWEIKKDAVIPPHKHEHEMIVNVLQGKLELRIGDETRVLEPGIAGMIPSNVIHEAKGITNCRVLDVFYPVREDYKFS